MEMAPYQGTNVFLYGHPFRFYRTILGNHDLFILNCFIDSLLFIQQNIILKKTHNVKC